MDAEIINVGSEILIGDTLNNCQQFLVSELANIDVNVYGTNTAGFDPHSLRELLSPPSTCWMDWSYGSHPNYYLSEEYDAQFDYCRSIQNEPYETILEETYKAEMIYLEEVVHCPVVQVVNYTLFSDRLEVPVQTYIPSFGWGTMYGDIVE